MVADGSMLSSSDLLFEVGAGLVRAERHSPEVLEFEPIAFEFVGLFEQAVVDGGFEVDEVALAGVGEGEVGEDLACGGVGAGGEGQDLGVYVAAPAPTPPQARS